MNMSMSGMNMASATATSTMAMSMSATSTASTSMSSSTSMSMDMDNSCNISMLWNWNTVGSCFLSETWYIATKAQFGGTLVGIFFLCMAIELVRRLGREYDQRLTLQRNLQSESDPKVEDGRTSVRHNTLTSSTQISWVQQIIRSLFYGSQFTGAFLVMLLGMYFNGFVLFAIFIGHTIGYLVFGKDTVRLDLGQPGESVSTNSGCCC